MNNNQNGQYTTKPYHEQWKSLYGPDLSDLSGARLRKGYSKAVARLVWLSIFSGIAYLLKFLLI